MSISQAVYEAQIQRIADLQAKLAEAERERDEAHSLWAADRKRLAEWEQGNAELWRQLADLRAERDEAVKLLREARPAVAAAFHASFGRGERLLVSIDAFLAKVTP